jgi:hypothetical protein
MADTEIAYDPFHVRRKMALGKHGVLYACITFSNSDSLSRLVEYAVQLCRSGRASSSAGLWVVQPAAIEPDDMFCLIAKVLVVQAQVVKAL